MIIKAHPVLSLLFLLNTFLLCASRPAGAATCENSWGSAAKSQPRAGVPKAEDVQLCLPAGFSVVIGEEGVSFRDPNDSTSSKGSLGIAISPDSTYSYSDKESDYLKLQGWLCQLANVSAGTRCTIIRLKNNLFVMLKSLGIGVYSEVYIHTGNGYMLALTAEAPNESALSLLRTVIEDANIP